MIYIQARCHGPALMWHEPVAEVLSGCNGTEKHCGNRTQVRSVFSLKSHMSHSRAVWLQPGSKFRSFWPWTAKGCDCNCTCEFLLFRQFLGVSLSILNNQLSLTIDTDTSVSVQVLIPGSSPSLLLQTWTSGREVTWFVSLCFPQVVQDQCLDRRHCKSTVQPKHATQ